MIIPDASPVLTLARVGHLDLLSCFDVPILIVDQVHYEITKHENDPRGGVKAGLERLHNRIRIVETAVGQGFKLMRQKDPNFRSKDLGEDAVSEYARTLAKTSGPSFVPLVLFEDPDVLELPIVRLKNVHLLNTSAWLMGLWDEGRLDDAPQIVAAIDAGRRIPMNPFEREARTKKIISTWRRKLRDAGP